MEKHSLAVNAIASSSQNKKGVECVSAYILEKPAKPLKLMPGEWTSPLLLYPEENVLRGGDTEEIAFKSHLHLVENGPENQRSQHTLLSSPLSTGYNYLVKRLMDILISGFLMITLLSWLFPMIGILIKLDSEGPVFFLQKRNKKGGSVFNCIKFRSMFLNPEADVRATFDNDPE